MGYVHASGCSIYKRLDPHGSFIYVVSHFTHCSIDLHMCLCDFLHRMDEQQGQAVRRFFPDERHEGGLEDGCRVVRDMLARCVHECCACLDENSLHAQRISVIFIRIFHRPASLVLARHLIYFEFTYIRYIRV